MVFGSAVSALNFVFLDAPGKIVENTRRFLRERDFLAKTGRIAIQNIAFAVAALIFLFALAARPAFCQLSISAAPSVPNNEFGVWGGSSFGNPHVIGTTGDRRLTDVGLRYSRTLWEPGSNVSLRYTLDIIPVEILNQPAYVACSGGYCQTGRETVYGGGVNPLGLKLNFFRADQWQPFIASTAGFVASVERIPVDIPGGTLFNFTFDFQAGVQHFNSSRTRAWMLGYKFQHISNAYRSSFNPGVDANVVFIGFSFFR